MRVAVVVILLMHQRVADPQFVEDRRVRFALAVLFKDRFADHRGGHLPLLWQIVGVGETAVVINRRVDRQLVLRPQEIVVQSVSGRDVDEAGPGGVIHERVPGEKFSGALAKRMLVFDLTEMVAVQTADDFVAFPTAFGGDGGQKHRGEDERLGAHPNLRVTEGGIVGHCQIRGQCPRGCRPDQDRGVRVADDREPHIDTLADVVQVLDFRLGQRRPARDAPIDRFLAAINKTPLDDVREQAQFVRFIFLVEREVRMVPIAEHAEALELRALNVDEPARVRVTRLADRGGRGGRVAGLAHLLGDFEFDRQAVAIPARHVWRAAAAQGVIFDDDVLEDLVQRVADVDFAIGERRAVVQHKLFALRAGGLDLLVQPHGCPCFQPLGFAGDQVRFHGKVGARQIQRRLVIHARFSRSAHANSRNASDQVFKWRRPPARALRQTFPETKARNPEKNVRKVAFDEPDDTFAAWNEWKGRRVIRN